MPIDDAIAVARAMESKSIARVWINASPYNPNKGQAYSSLEAARGAKGAESLATYGPFPVEATEYQSVSVPVLPTSEDDERIVGDLMRRNTEQESAGQGEVTGTVVGQPRGDDLWVVTDAKGVVYVMRDEIEASEAAAEWDVEDVMDAPHEVRRYVRGDVPRDDGGERVIEVAEVRATECRSVAPNLRAMVKLLDGMTDGDISLEFGVDEIRREVAAALQALDCGSVDGESK